MAAGNFFIFGAALEAMLNGTIDLDDDSFRMVLVTEDYTPVQATHAVWSSISSNEVADGNGYTTHGEAVTVSFSRSGVVVTFDCDDQSWSAATITAKYAVIVRDADGNGALAAGDIPIAYVDLETEGGSLSSTNGTFAVNINASGVFTVSAAADS